MCPRARNTEQRSNAPRRAQDSVRTRATVGLRAPKRTREPLVARKLRLWRAERVARSIAYSYGFELDELLYSRGRARTLVRARHHLWTVIQHTLDLSTPEIARAFGVDHSTVLYAVRKFERHLAAMYPAAPVPRLAGTERAAMVMGT